MVSTPWTHGLAIDGVGRAFFVSQGNAMNSDRDALYWIWLGVRAVIGMLAAVLIVAAIATITESRQINTTESDWPQTITSAGRMITVKHDGHQYVVTTHGEHGVHVIHSPNCPCMKAER